MNIFFRVDGSTEIGTGHVMRCALLAEFLAKEGATVSFLVRQQQGHLCEWLKNKDFRVFPMNQGYFSQAEDAQEVIEIIKNKSVIHWMVVDHYGLDEQWEKTIKGYVEKIFVIDDLANRKHVCDCLLDQNYVSNFKHRYDQLVSKACQLFLGVEYVLFRPEFLSRREQLRVRDGTIKRILIFFGGSDPTNETMKVLEALQIVNDIHIDVVVGNANSYRDEVKEICQQYGYYYHCQIDYVSTLMNEADFSFGAGGVTMWERCFLGLPSAVTIVADNQLEATEATAKTASIWNMGFHDQVKIQNYTDILHKAISTPQGLKEMSENAKQLIGNLEQPHPVVQVILEG